MFTAIKKNYHPTALLTIEGLLSKMKNIKKCRFVTVEIEHLQGFKIKYAIMQKIPGEKKSYRYSHTNTY